MPKHLFRSLLFSLALRASPSLPSAATVATAQYRPQLLTRIGYVDLNALTAKVDADIDIARRGNAPQNN